MTLVRERVRGGALIRVVWESEVFPQLVRIFVFLLVGWTGFRQHAGVFDGTTQRVCVCVCLCDVLYEFERQQPHPSRAVMK